MKREMRENARYSGGDRGFCVPLESPPLPFSEDDDDGVGESADSSSSTSSVDLLTS